ncbi:MAG: MFS transporter [Dehalococcoidales bacterium]|nr:MFS transporter [Dehalococcoidales bacterium]
MSRDRNQRSFWYRWGGGTAVLFAYTHFSHDLCNGLLIALLPLIKENLGLSYLQSGLLLSALTITSGLSQFLGGWIGDRMSRQIVIAIGLAGIGLASLAVGMISSYYLLLIILIIMGIFAGAYHPSAVSVLSSHIERARRGKAFAFHMVGGSIGYAVGPFLGGLIAELLGWRFAFIILSIPILTAIPLVLNKFREQRHLKDSQKANPLSASDVIASHPRQKSTGIIQILQPMAVIISLAILTQLIGGTAMVFIPIYLVDKHYITPTYAAMLMGVTRAGGITGSLFGGWLSDRWGRKNTIFLSLAAIGPILYILTLLPFNAGLIVILIVFGLFMYMRQAAVQPFLMDNVPSRIRATIFGIYFGLGMEGMSLMQPVAGHFMDIFGIIAIFQAIAWISVVVSVLSLLLVRKA